MNASVSIVTTTKGRPNDLLRLVESLRVIRDEIEEFIVVNAGTDADMDVLFEHLGYTRIVDGKNTNRAGGKNLGIEHAKGDVVAFLDDDTTIDSFWLKELQWSLQYGDVIAGYSANPFGLDMPRVSCNYKGNDISFPSCNLAVKKEVFDTVGMFNENFITAEDMDFNFRCVDYGYNIFYNPSMEVYHYHRSTRLGFYRQAFWNGYGRKQLNLEHPKLCKRHETGINFKNISRLGFGLAGYLFGGWLK